MMKRFEGPQTMGSGWAWWSVVSVVVLVFAFLPLHLGAYGSGNFSFFLLMVFGAFGLSLMWGQCGILSLGQTAFFGIGGYTYAVVSGNLHAADGLTLVSAVIAVGMASLVGLVVGYFMFYGRIRGLFVGVITLVVTLVLNTFLTQTGGAQWKVGSVFLEGDNGINNIVPISIPWVHGWMALHGESLYWVLLALCVVVYMFLRWLQNSRLGDRFVAVRENYMRAEALGYDTRFYQTVAFTIGCGLAGLSGVFYTTWGGYISPSTMDLTAAIGPIVWVSVSGRSNLTSVAIGTVLIVWVDQFVDMSNPQFALIIMGLLLTLSTLFTPNGAIYGVFQLAAWVMRAIRGRVAGDSGGSNDRGREHGARA